MSYFKIAVLTIFSVSILAGIVLFAMSKTSNSGANSSPLVVWGTMDDITFSNAYAKSSIAKADNLRIDYVKKNQADFDTGFVEALAEGRGPDVVILRDDLVYKNRNKLFVIPYKNYSERTFKDTFIEAGEIFLSEAGIVAVPFTVDPMVMYWNRDLFGSNQISQPPKSWEEIYSLINKITIKDDTGNIMQSAIALGEWRNITNAKELLSMLLLQAGTPITMRSEEKIVSVLDEAFGLPRRPSESAVDFFTQFSNSNNISYTWNRSLPTSLNFFLQGRLAMYIGFSSELFSIKQKNSNLNFDVTYVPQVKDTKKKSVFGHVQALALVKQSKQTEAGFVFINAMTEQAPLKSIEEATALPPVRRDMLATVPADPFRTVFYNSAIIANSWTDPEPGNTSEIFRDMIESITGGKSMTAEAISRANSRLSAELR